MVYNRTRRLPLYAVSYTHLDVYKRQVQFRTIAMDFWASLEHKLKYKKDIDHSEEIAQELEVCAEIISSMDERMQEIRNRIERG